MNGGRRFSIYLIAALVIGSLNGSGFLWEEFQNNNQGEYFDPITHVVDWPYAAEMFLIVAIPTALVAYILAFAFGEFLRIAFHSRRKN